MVTPDKNRKIKNAPLNTLTLVFTLAVFFLLWGFLLFYTIGDKGPPSWDFGVVQDIPGESAYSTQRPLPGRMSLPEPQHVSQKPQAIEDGEKAKGEKR
jgi:hypothetical protein